MSPNSKFSFAPHFANMAVLLAVAFVLATHNVAAAPAVGNEGGVVASSHLVERADVSMGSIAASDIARGLQLERADHPLSKRRLRRHRAGLHARRSLPRRQDTTDGDDDEGSDDDGEDGSETVTATTTDLDPERTGRATPTDSTTVSSTQTVTSTATSLVYSESSTLTTKETITSTLVPEETSSTSDWTQTYTATLTMGVNGTSSTDQSSSKATSTKAAASSTDLDPKIPVVTSGTLEKAVTTDTDSSTSTRRHRPHQTSSADDVEKYTIGTVVWTHSASPSPSSSFSADAPRITVDGAVWVDMSFMVPASLVESISMSRGSYVAQPSATADLRKRTVTATASAPPLLTGSTSATATATATAGDDDDDDDDDDCEDEDETSTSADVKAAATSSAKTTSSSKKTSSSSTKTSSTTNAFPTVANSSSTKSSSTKTSTTSTKASSTSTKTSTPTTNSSSTTSSSSSTAAFDTFWDSFLGLFKELASGNTTASAEIPSETSSIWKTVNSAFGFSKRDLGLLDGEEWEVREVEPVLFIRED
ncbi:hypothetical protein BCV69DRAFT_283087 [Microstroma glucosiphilum]|uniref:Uncharacterized protein n=1 Tax=Pseudomicrostroma glucosiphilum TaxID=1684307 RepID=A0A316U5U4_9BASI|nr:hypothetical protein BCV69DRAFT_283087 [Pseudomicrostroma glucosiphilum]PWN20208.1 hypothetical protein BCV69DRAFT_283087 [Pseudomicrostroma glucosiphilum]